MSDGALNVPVVLIVFNRPDLTAQVLARVRAARPRQVFVVADGPRPGHPTDAENCRQVRAVLDAGIDWPCDVRRDEAAANLGCRRRVASGITRVFEQVETAILLEDDCLPEPRFFDFCAELLARYRDEPRVGVIGGVNFQSRDVTDGRGYFFSRYPHCWGWATWRRAWASYDPELKEWPAVRRTGWLRQQFASAREAHYWERIFDRTAAGEIDSWDYAWVYACWRQGLLTALPAASLVTNLGFGAEATHTHAPALGLADAGRTQPWPLRHPATVARHEAADAYTYRHHYDPTWPDRIARRLRRLGLLG